MPPPVVPLVPVVPVVVVVPVPVVDVIPVVDVVPVVVDVVVPVEPDVFDVLPVDPDVFVVEDVEPVLPVVDDVEPVLPVVDDVEPVEPSEVVVPVVVVPLVVVLEVLPLPTVVPLVPLVAVPPGLLPPHPTFANAARPNASNAPRGIAMQTSNEMRNRPEPAPEGYATHARGVERNSATRMERASTPCISSRLFRAPKRSARYAQRFGRARAVVSSSLSQNFSNFARGTPRNSSSLSFSFSGTSVTSVASVR